MTRSVATDTKVKVEIDQQTKDELQPPCDGTTDYAPCAHPSEVATIGLTCPACGVYPARLHCDVHASYLRQHVEMDCGRCDTIDVVFSYERMEPLR
jgi:hypothetical protein